MLTLVLVPMIFALLCIGLPNSLLRRFCLVSGAALHLYLVAMSWRHPLTGGDYLALDPVGHLFVTFISVLFLATTIYFVGYHQRALVSHRVFLGCMLALLSALTLACASRHLGLMWVALEASSLAATPLIYFHLGARSLEATWKFLLMNSVGIALALLGILSLGLSTTALAHPPSLTVDGLVAVAARLDPVWLRAGFLLALVGFGTKMGLAPLHSWKPDAYGEAPPPIAALLAGAMTLGAFLGILRFLQVANAAGQSAFASLWLSVFGLLSIATAAVFVIGNTDYRRILAYTSVEHMGVLVLGAGLGAAGSKASMLHAMHNTLNKGVLFFVAGILWRIYHSNRTADVRGAIHRTPIVGILLLAGLCATCGLPPFGMFFSELGILFAAVGQAHWVIAGFFALTLAIVFVGVMTAFLPMVFGQPSEPAEQTAEKLPGWGWRKPIMLIPTGALVLLAFSLGSYQPQRVTDALQAAAAAIYPAAQAPPPAVAAAPEPAIENQKSKTANPLAEVSR